MRRRKPRSNLATHEIGGGQFSPKKKKMSPRQPKKGSLGTRKGSLPGKAEVVLWTKMLMPIISGKKIKTGEIMGRENRWERREGA